MMKNIFIFLEDELSIKFFTIKLFILTNNNKPNKNKTGTRRVPKKKATLLDIGTKMKSETTGDMYIVSQRKDGRKMWKKIETN